MIQGFLRVMTILVLIGLSFSLPALAQAEGFSRYEISVALDPQARVLSGTEKVEYLNDTGKPLEEAIFTLGANGGREQNPYLHPALQDPQYPQGFDPTWTEILSVQDGEGNLLDYRLEAIPPFIGTYSLQDGLLYVNLSQPLQPGERAAIAIEFQTKFAHAMIGDTSFYRGVYTWRFGWNPLAYSPELVQEEQYQLPAAFYRVELTVPPEFVVAGGAEHQEIISQDEGGKTILLESNVPVRSVTLVMGKDLERYRLVSRDTVIDSYYLPGDESTGRLIATYAAEILDYYNQHFGPFAYNRLVIAENPMAGFFGMGADGVILLGASNYRLKDVPVPGLLDRLLEYLAAHEIGHQWWGIGVGTDFNAENWISEGCTEYLAYTYFEDKYGGYEPNLFAHVNNGILEELVRSELGFFNLRRHMQELSYLDLVHNRFDEAIVKPMRDVKYFNYQTVRIYQKGYLVMRALEGLLGRDMMHEIMREVYSRYDHRILTVAGFRGIAEEISGQDLEDFFASWLYGADTLDISAERFETEEAADGYRTTVYLSKRGAAIYPVTVQAVTADGEELQKTWGGDQAQGSVTFTSSSPVVEVNVDPLEMSPDLNRFNNHLPRKVIVKHPFTKDDWKIGLPLDAYLIEVSPLGISGLFRNDHYWGINIVPDLLVAEEAGQESEEFRLVWNALGYLQANLDRGLSLDGSASLSEYDPADGTGDLNTQLGLNFTHYEHPEIGVTGRYWWPADNTRVSAGVEGELSQPIAFAGLDYSRLDILKLYLVNSLSLRVGLPLFDREPFATLEWSGFKRFRLAHLLYLDGSLSAGTGLFGAQPEPFQHRLDLHSFEEDFPNHRRAFGRLDLRLPPLVQGMGYSLLNLARMDSISASLFVQGGQTWAEDEPLRFNDLKAEAGATITATAASLLGLPLVLTVGYAYPIQGAEPEAEGKVFFGFSTSL